MFNKSTARVAWFSTFFELIDIWFSISQNSRKLCFRKIWWEIIISIFQSNSVRLGGLNSNNECQYKRAPNPSLHLFFFSSDSTASFWTPPTETKKRDPHSPFPVLPPSNSVIYTISFRLACTILERWHVGHHIGLRSDIMPGNEISPSRTGWISRDRGGTASFGTDRSGFLWPPRCVDSESTVTVQWRFILGSHGDGAGPGKRKYQLFSFVLLLFSPVIYFNHAKLRVLPSTNFNFNFILHERLLNVFQFYVYNNYI